MKNTTTAATTYTITTWAETRAVEVVAVRPNGIVIAVDRIVCGCVQPDPAAWTYYVFLPEHPTMPETYEATKRAAFRTADRLRPVAA